MERQKNKQKAIDIAMYQNASYRFDNNYGVVESGHGDYIIIQTDNETFHDADFETLPKDYSNMSYQHIKGIVMDVDPLHHWEELKGAFSLMNGEQLRFLLNLKVPLDKFIRFELANRGYDENFNWVGFEASEKIWLV